MAFEDRTNRLVQPVYPGAPNVFTLPPGGKILSGKLIVTGNVVISGGTTNGVVTGEGGPINLLNRLKVTCNRAAGSRYPGGRIVDCGPRSLLRYATIEHQGKFIGELSGSVLGSGAAGTYPIYLSIPIYWADSALLNQVQTALNADPVDSTGAPIYKSIQVQVDWASNLTGCFAGNDRVLNLSGITVQWVDDRLSIASDTIPLVQEDHDFLIEATQTRAMDNGMLQDGSYTCWLILAEQSFARTFSDVLLNRVTIVAPTLNLDLYAQDIRQGMYDDEWYDPAQSGVGQFFLDFTHGLLQNSNPAAGIAAKFDVNNPSGAALDQLKFYTRRVYTLLAAS
jgi:hypothetical protein